MLVPKLLKIKQFVLVFTNTKTTEINLGVVALL